LSIESFIDRAAFEPFAGTSGLVMS